MHKKKVGKKMKQRKPYEKPAVIFENELESLAAACGVGEPNIYLGDNNCKGAGTCIITFS